MSRALVEAERVKYEAAWADPRYRVKAHGLGLWRSNRALFPESVRSALDIGCGHGRLMAQWCREGIDAWGVDLVDALDTDVRKQYRHRVQFTPIWEYQAPRKPVDLAVAADVLEHLPIQMVDTSLMAIGRTCRAFICQNAEFPSRFLGSDLHLTMQPSEWWMGKMLSIGGSVEQCQVDCGYRRHVLRWHPPW